MTNQHTWDKTLRLADAFRDLRSALYATGHDRSTQMISRARLVVTIALAALVARCASHAALAGA